MSEELKPCPACGSCVLKVNHYTCIVECQSCGLRGPFDRESPEKAWNALPRKLHWTKKKPTEPGFWFYRRDSSGIGIILVGHDGEVLFVMSDGKCCPVTDFGNGVLTEWAGPIPEPEEGNHV